MINNPAIIMQELTTERLVLMQPSNDDAHELFLLRSNEKVNTYLDRPKTNSVEDALIFIQKINENIRNKKGLYWIIRLKDEPHLAGTIALWNFSPENSCAEIGYELLPHFQGRGIMHEALEKVLDYALRHAGFKKIEAWTHRENSASSRLLEKNNFKRDLPAEAKYAATGELGNMTIYTLLNSAE